MSACMYCTKEIAVLGIFRSFSTLQHATNNGSCKVWHQIWWFLHSFTLQPIANSVYMMQEDKSRRWTTEYRLEFSSETSMLPAAIRVGNAEQPKCRDQRSSPSPSLWMARSFNVPNLHVLLCELVLSVFKRRHGRWRVYVTGIWREGLRSQGYWNSKNSDERWCKSTSKKICVQDFIRFIDVPF